MSLHTYTDIEQRSDEWLELRRGIVTASVVGQLVTAKKLEVASNDYSRALTMQLVAERITGWAEEPYVSNDMLRGRLDEPVARDLYSEHYAPVTEVGFMVNDDHGFRIGYSPDGLVGEDGLLEIKSRRPKAQVATVIADAVPADAVAQCQAGLLVSGRKWLDYVSFAGGMSLFVKRVYPDERWRNAIVAAVSEFEATAEQMISTYRERTAVMPMTERSTYDMEIAL